MIFNRLILGTVAVVMSLISGSNAQVRNDLVVATDGSGNYKTVQEAFNAVPKNSATRTVIYIKNGIYKEKLELSSDRQNVTLIGQDRDKVKLTYDDYSGKVVNGITIGTSTSRSTNIAAEGFCALNISFENSSGSVGQAVAIYISGDKSIFYNCNFLGRQDTWYAGSCRQFIRKCYLEGTTDFLFGPSTAWIDSCKIYTYGGSAITAASTDQQVSYGYVFRYCEITGLSGQTTTLGRPWRPYSAVSFLNTSMTSSIQSAGWDNWGDVANESTTRYSEYKNTGIGASTSGRVKWAKQLTDLQAANYTYKNVLKNTNAAAPVTDNWDPMITLALYISNSTGTKQSLHVQQNSLDFSMIQSARQLRIFKISEIRYGKPVSLLIHDICGRVVYKAQMNGNEKISFALPLPAPGIYQVSVASDGHIIHKNIIIR